jgi:hypothetical protein
MPWSCAKSAIWFLARENEVDRFRPWKSIWLVEEVESSEAPVYSVESKVLSIVVFEFIFALQDVSRWPRLQRARSEIFQMT